MGYGFVELDSDQTSYQIQRLTPGASYFVSISAKNKRGYGARQNAVLSPITLPRQIPGPPTGIAAYVNWGYNDQLRVTIGKPLSNGGAAIEKYVVEWDATPSFDNPGRQEFPCPEFPSRSVWVVKTQRDTGTAALTDEHFFSLTLNGLTPETTLPIAWDAMAMATDEVPAIIEATSDIHCEGTGDQSAWFPHCLTSREKASGSMQSKLEVLRGIKSVRVTRSDGLIAGSKVWSITFLDDGDGFQLSLAANANTKNLAAGWDVKVNKVLSGTPTPFPSCTGTQIIPTLGGLTQGQLYYVRAFAYNTIGYSVHQRAVSPEKPQVRPGLPTGVTLEVVSSSKLRVVFSPPDDNGGDTIERYLVEWDTQPGFPNPEYFAVTEFNEGFPNIYIMGSIADPLVRGQNYWVRVSACNTGSCESGVCCGNPQASSPAFLNPHESPSAPVEVNLYVTSPTMLTVSWVAPTNDGGDAITGYRIEHDLSPGFNSLALPPDKDSTDVPAGQRSFTIEQLTQGTPYYVRVFAINDAGPGAPQTASPESAVPSLQLPGLPHSIIAASGAASGEIDLKWDRPYIPYHNTPCVGTESGPSTECPTPAGGGDPQSDGGAVIDQYMIEYCDMVNDCTDGWGGTVVSKQEIATTNQFTLENLNPGHKYAIRIAAVNSVGIGRFCQHEDEYCFDTADPVTAVATA